MLSLYLATETFGLHPGTFLHTYRCRFSGLTIRASRFAPGEPVTLRAWVDNGNMSWSGRNAWAPDYSMAYKNDPIDRLPEVTAPPFTVMERWRLEQKLRKAG